MESDSLRRKITRRETRCKLIGVQRQRLCESGCVHVMWWMCAWGGGLDFPSAQKYTWSYF